MKSQRTNVIIIGMHRSGTSLLAHLLQRAGVQMGADASPAHTESLFFLKQNKFMFRVAHADWDNPEPMKYLLRDSDLCDALVSHLKTVCYSWPICSFLGFFSYLKYRSLTTYHKPWGWKDPRNTYTLPIWLRLFPEARILNIYRNGIDVAGSLLVREQKRRRQLNNPRLSCRCLEVGDAFELWVEYVRMSFQVTHDLPADRVYHISFEAFVEQPAEYLADILQFAGVDVNISKVKSIVSGIKSERAHAFVNNPGLVELYRQKSSHPLMIQLGYMET